MRIKLFLRKTNIIFKITTLNELKLCILNYIPLDNNLNVRRQMPYPPAVIFMLTFDRLLTNNKFMTLANNPRMGNKSRNMTKRRRKNEMKCYVSF